MPFVEFRAWVAEIGRRREEEQRARQDAEMSRDAAAKKRQFYSDFGVR